MRKQKLKKITEKELRIEQLEEKARILFITNSKWGQVIDMLSAKEQKEYYKLMKQVYGE